MSNGTSRRVANRGRGQAGGSVRSRISANDQLWFFGLAAFLVITASLGGGSRPDILSLVILRPIAVLACVLAAWRVTTADVRRYCFAFAMCIAIIGLTFIHLVPLPPALWQSLPGRSLVVTVDAEIGLQGVWRPLTLAPPETLNALFSLIVPSAVLLLSAPLDRVLLERLLLVVIAIGLVSGLLGLLQLVGSPTGPLFFYAHTNYGAATGLFANRNHQAIFLATLFPMLATLVTLRSRGEHAMRDGYAALAAGLFLIPLLLITGSRAGMLLGALGLGSAPFLLRFQPSRRSSTGVSFWYRISSPRALAIVGVLLAVGLTILTVGMSRAVSVSRFMEVGANEELRFKVWPVIASSIPTYLPLGSGIGSFAAVFQIMEPDRILRPTYLNHAHNEVLEVLLTAGIPGAVLLVTALIGWAVAVRRAFTIPLAQDGVLFARLGLVVTALLALGSIGDYPLRTPFLAALLVVAALWSGSVGRRSAKQPGNQAGR